MPQSSQEKTQRRLLYPESTSSDSVQRGTGNKKTSRATKKLYTSTITNGSATNTARKISPRKSGVLGKRAKSNLESTSITETQKSYCCVNKCLQSGKCVQKSDIVNCRQKFWGLDETNQRAYILNFFLTNTVKLKGKKQFIFLVEGKQVCNKAWLKCHGISKWRFYTLKREYNQGRTSPKSARGTTRVAGKQLVNAEQWFKRYYETLADHMPDTGYHHLPSCQTVKGIYNAYREETMKGKYAVISLTQFRRMWKSSFKRVVIPKQSRFSKCGVCVLLKEHLQTTSIKCKRTTWLERKQFHIDQQWSERKKYYKHVKKSLEQPKKYLSLIIDGMDQGKTHLPHFVVKSKVEKGSTGFSPTHVTGVIAHGQDLKLCLIDQLKWPADANVTINVLVTVLKYINEQFKVAPPVLYLQMDNCFRDCKNIYIFGFCALLVMTGVFKKVRLSYLMVGHTHEDVYQMFSRISTALSKKPATTLGELHKVIHESFSPEPVTVDLANIFDIKSWILPCIPRLTHHSRHHAFRFKKSPEGHVEMTYRNWSKAGRKEWKPETPIRILEQRPVGAPNLLKPEFRKCPTLDELERGLDQIKVRLNPDEVEWWNEFIRRARNERCTWENIADDDLKKAGMASFTFPEAFKEELENVGEDDKAAKKRMDEIERLIEKSNSFPEIKQTTRRKED